MTSFKAGQVVLIPFPFTDLSTVKQRPGLVISAESFNLTHSDLIIVAHASLSTWAGDKRNMSGFSYIVALTLNAIKPLLPTQRLENTTRWP